MTAFIKSGHGPVSTTIVDQQIEQGKTFEEWWAAEDTNGLSEACKMSAWNAWLAATKQAELARPEEGETDPLADHRAGISALQRDAARYRWLKKNCQYGFEDRDGPQLVHRNGETQGSTNPRWREELDAAIDSEMDSSNMNSEK